MVVSARSVDVARCFSDSVVAQLGGGSGVERKKEKKSCDLHLNLLGNRSEDEEEDHFWQEDLWQLPTPRRNS